MIGILALQGGFQEHAQTLSQLSSTSTCALPSKFIRNASDLTNESLSGLIIPGGESTVMRTLLERDPSLYKALFSSVQKLPVLATCAGLILLASRVRDHENAHVEPGFLPSLDVTVVRNWYGSQNESFSTVLCRSGVTALFIRAPWIEEVGSAAQIEDWISTEDNLKATQRPTKYSITPTTKQYHTISESPITVAAVRQGKIIGLTCHPELVEGQFYWHEKAFGRC